jgi:hypothetical protein
MVEDFPISTEQLVALLEMVAPLNREVAKARAFLDEKVPTGLFPVRMKIPIAMSVHLAISFSHMQLVTEDNPEWWHVPESYRRSSMLEQLQALGDKIERLVLEEDGAHRANPNRLTASGSAGSGAPGGAGEATGRGDAAPRAPTSTGERPSIDEVGWIARANPSASRGGDRV